MDFVNPALLPYLHPHKCNLIHTINRIEKNIQHEAAKIELCIHDSPGIAAFKIEKTNE